MEPFAPQPWEMPPGARVLEESASVVAREFDGERLNWKVALIEVPAHKIAPILWMRPLDERFDAGFVSFGNTDHELLTLSQRVEPFALRASLSTVLKYRRLARFFVLNKNGELRREGEAACESLLIASDGVGAWNLSGVTNSNRGTARFNFDAPVSNEEFSRSSSARIWQRLTTDVNEDAAYARQFVHLSERECRALIFNKTRGTDEEVEKWIRTLLLCEDVWSEPALGEELCLQSHSPSNLQLHWDDDYFGKSADVSPALQTNVARVRNWYLSANQEVAHYSCVKQWLNHNNSRFAVSIHRPTAHEQLEASLRWREWLASH